MKLLEVYREYMKFYSRYGDPVYMISMSETGIHMAAANATEFIKWLGNEGGAIAGYYLDDDDGTLWLYGKLEGVQLYTLLYGNEIDIDLSTIREFKKHGGVVTND